MAAENSRQEQTPLVSIIMPTYNAARYVAESIDSIVAQSYTHWELLITDDSSSDDTVSIVSRYAAQDARITLFVTATNGGAGVARNRSLAAAKGRYIAFCDSDDRWCKEKLATQVAFMQEHNVALSFAPYYTCDLAGTTTGYVPAPRRVSLFSTMCDDKIGFLTCLFDRQQLGVPLMPLLRRRQDYAYVLLLLQKCRRAYSVPQPQGYYRVHSDSLSGKKIALLRYNAQTYTVVFGWHIAVSYLFLFTFFLPTYFVKRLRNRLINLRR